MKPDFVTKKTEKRSSHKCKEISVTVYRGTEIFYFASLLFLISSREVEGKLAFDCSSFLQFFRSFDNMEFLNIALVQTTLHWEDKAANFAMLEAQIASITQAVDLIVLPEMFSTGFSMKAAQFAESMNGESVQWLAAMAKQKQAVITGSLIIEEEDKYYNRLIWMRPDGSLETYDKRHLFRLAKEQNTYTAGSVRKIVMLKNWRINLQVCYDLRFPVWARNREDYDCLLYVANWPERRGSHWKALLRARAIENMCYVIGLNRVGDDGNDIYHSGDSAVIQASGAPLIEAAHQDAILFASLSKSKLKTYRERFGFYKDRDEFSIL